MVHQKGCLLCFGWHGYECCRFGFLIIDVNAHAGITSPEVIDILLKTLKEDPDALVADGAAWALGKRCFGGER